MLTHGPTLDGNNYVLDPTYPGVCDFIEETYRRLTESWGYDYLKLDFMRSVFINPRARYHDPEATSLEAYRMALEAIRRGAGPGHLHFRLRRPFRGLAGHRRLPAQRQ